MENKPLRPEAPPIRGPMFYEWNYDTMAAIEYERLGECNGCGTCCKGTFNMTMLEGDRQDHGGYTVDGKGIWSEVVGESEEREFVRFEMAEDEKTPCSALTPDNQCNLHGEGKAWCCRVFPTSPRDIADLPECSYKFREVQSWNFTDEE